MATSEQEVQTILDDSTDQYLAHRETMALEATRTAFFNDTTMPAAGKSRAPSDAEPDIIDKAIPQQDFRSRVVKDVVRGTVELPRSVVKGARDAIQATLNTTEELDDWVQSKVPLGGFQIRNPETKDFDFKYLSSDEWKKLTSEEKGIELPDLPGPRSTTGRMIKGISQFVVGMTGAGKIKALQNLKALGTAGKITGTMAQAAIADFFVFEPDTERLSNLIETVPALQNPVSEYLASDPDDGAAEGRFKNAIEGLGLGAVATGFNASVRALRGWKHAKEVVESVRPKLRDDAFEALGDPDLPAVVTKSDLEKRLSTATDATKESFKDVPSDGVFINWSRIDAPEDVLDAMKKMADSHAADIDAARRGVKTFAEIELGADQVDAWDTLLRRRMGDPLNAEQSVAARRLWVSSADKLSQLSKTAAENPSEANLFAFRKMLATHYAIQKEVIGARTETARALSSWRIPTGSSAERLRDIEYILESNGGTDVSRELARRIAVLSDSGMARELDQVVERSVYAKTRDAMIEGWVMGLLSGPKTHAVNIMSNTSVVGMQMYERATAAQIAKLLGDEGSVQLGEASAQFFGIVQGYKDALRYAAKSARTGESGFGLGKVDIPYPGAISSEALGMSNTGIGRAVDGIGTIVRIPGRALQAEDEFFKTIGYRMEINAQAMRMARKEVLDGTIPTDQLKNRIAEIVENPPENIRLQAVDQATYQTFTNTPGDFAKGLSKIANRYPLTRTLIPFIRTPANILHYSFERTPLAPLMSTVRADIAAGGARRDLALARMGTGTAIMMTMADMTLNGNMSGGGPIEASKRTALRRAGWQPYSVKIGDKWFAYNRLDPAGMLMGVSADMVEMLANTDWDSPESQDAEAVAVALAASIGNNAMSKTYLRGISEFFEAMSDPKRYSESYAQRFASTMVPAASLSGEIRRINDPYMREVRSMVEAMRNRTPGLSKSLPVRRDLWGRELSYQSPMGAAYDMFSPFYASRENPEPIDKEILTGGEYSRAKSESREESSDRESFNVSMPNRKTSFDGVIVDLDQYPGAYSRYMELAGNELKHPAWGLGAKDFLNQVVSGKHPLSQVYQIRSDGPDGGKETFIRDTINDYRSKARDQLLKEYPDLRRDVEDRQGRKRELQMPVLQ